MVFFVIPADSLSISSVQKIYKNLREKFINFNKYGLNGIQPFLIITKGDLSQPEYVDDKSKIYDDEKLRRILDDFCSKTLIPLDSTFFVANYIGGNNFEPNHVVDFTSLFAVNQALTFAQGMIRKVYDSLTKIEFQFNIDTKKKLSIKTSQENEKTSKISIQKIPDEVPMLVVLLEIDPIGFLENVKMNMKLSNLRVDIKKMWMIVLMILAIVLSIKNQLI